MDFLQDRSRSGMVLIALKTILPVELVFKAVFSGGCLEPLQEVEKDKLIAIASESFPPNQRAARREVLLFLAQHSGQHERERRARTHEVLLVLEKHHPRKKDEEARQDNLSRYLKMTQLYLDRFFDGSGETLHERRIQIVFAKKGQHPSDLYAIRFPLNTRTLLSRFWRLDQRVPTFIVYGLPLFERTENPLQYERKAEVNLIDEAERWADILYPFVAHGDLLAASLLTQLYASQELPVKFGAFTADDTVKHHLLPKTPKHSNAVIVGSVRVLKGILNEYQSGRLGQDSAQTLPFRLRIHDVVRFDDEENTIRERKRINESDVPVVITRRPGVHAPSSSVTLIASNHGTAVQYTVELLTDSKRLADLFCTPLLELWQRNLPRSFQILLYVTVLNDETRATRHWVEDVWFDREAEGREGEIV